MSIDEGTSRRPDRASDAPSADTLPIVVGVSRSSGSPAALRWALEESRVRGVPMVALRAYRVPGTAAGSVRPMPSRVADSEDPLRTAALDALRADVRRALGATVDLTDGSDGTDDAGPADGARGIRGDGSVELRAVRGARARVLLEASDAASLLVVDAPRRREIGTGPTFAAQLVQRARCPVVIMPGPVRGAAQSQVE
ncbi:universal stress protein [Brachybacterium sp. MASK1Z-5]|uniref:Universal stress protein n=1 Tax=Brachybacterium halotolerans TaxID=2795215 RepID=A0ABS1BEP2_9MICO|nr:universal stress protein [Brachybacterium halotolerans]MBK0333037.1 universal stress protein [Brachybacterium halotolerans]